MSSPSAFTCLLNRLALVAAVTLGVLPGIAAAAEPVVAEPMAQPVDQPADEAALRFFETSIRPVLIENCSECHGSETQWASLRIDTRKSLVTGGDSGPAIVPGHPEQSLLIKAVRQESEELQMPPEGKLTDRQIGDLTRWIAIGAPFPAPKETSNEPAPGDHWAFQPPAEPAVPAVQNAGWAASDLDRFVLARLEAEGLQPAPRADRRTLLRRVTFDLTGLPPTTAEVEAFVSDPDPDAVAFARVVDRLLASPTYGERWGRHWLDLARYADSNGLDENVAHGNAWRYRDYVVDAFNDDKPYDRFLTEQLAGDLLNAKNDIDRGENLVATGFLALGPKVLAEQDAGKMEMDIVDEQIDTFGRSLLGLTLGCARCHDHKFDPIATADYYGLAGIFKSTRTMESFKSVARWRENVLPSDESRAILAAHAAKIAEKKAAIEAATAGAATAPAGTDKAAADKAKAALKKLRDELAKLEKTPPEVPSAMGAIEGTVEDVAIHIRGSHLKLGDIVPRRVPLVFTTPEPPTFDNEHSGRLILAKWLTEPDHPLTSRVLVNRLWRWHFGFGLVRTPDNFGLLGEPPTHPLLLDWLALRFVESGWSVKAMHRTILLSNTYAQADVPSPGTLAKDPENRLLGRAPVRRLEAEAIRDALLAVSEALDRSLGGSLLAVKNRDYFFNHTSIDTTDYSSHRRSLYLPIVRNNVYEPLRLLDYPDPAVTTGDRTTTTVAPQALLMMNGELVIDAATALATELVRDSSRKDSSDVATEAERVQALYRRAYGREATADEIDASLAFLRDAESLFSKSEPAADQRARLAWDCLCQTILAANEFVYVR